MLVPIARPMSVRLIEEAVVHTVLGGAKVTKLRMGTDVLLMWLQETRLHHKFAVVADMKKAPKPNPLRIAFAGGTTVGVELLHGRENSSVCEMEVE